MHVFPGRRSNVPRSLSVPSIIAIGHRCGSHGAYTVAASIEQISHSIPFTLTQSKIYYAKPALTKVLWPPTDGRGELVRPSLSGDRIDDKNEMKRTRRTELQS